MISIYMYLITVCRVYTIQNLYINAAGSCPLIHPNYFSNFRNQHQRVMVRVMVNNSGELTDK